MYRVQGFPGTSFGYKTIPCPPKRSVLTSKVWALCLTAQIVRCHLDFQLFFYYRVLANAMLVYQFKSATKALRGHVDNTRTTPATTEW